MQARGKTGIADSLCHSRRGPRDLAHNDGSHGAFAIAYDLAWGNTSGATSGSTDYYVSATVSDLSGDGSLANRWGTSAYASGKVGPGATVHVATGTYTGSFHTYTSGTATARITYISDTKWSAKLIGTKGST